ncbi:MULTISPECIES: hypothetical protein [Leeuwenhoekiella]|uniref:hypothetical protein n=1 Tax=Leeuwenhoekiella TaxID=283735 RepID=UPI000C3C88F9|nr:hypothetical protein [Leeuwenhoekiella sp.]
MNNSWALVGTSDLGIGIDNNQITQSGNQLYLAAKDGSILFRTLAIDLVLLMTPVILDLGPLIQLGELKYEKMLL